MAILPSCAGWSASWRHFSNQVVGRGAGLPPLVGGLHPVGGINEVADALVLQSQFFPLQAVELGRGGLRHPHILRGGAVNGSTKPWGSGRIGVVHLGPEVASAASDFLRPAGVNRHRGEAVGDVVLPDLHLQPALGGGNGLHAAEEMYACDGL